LEEEHGQPMNLSSFAQPLIDEAVAIEESFDEHRVEAQVKRFARHSYCGANIIA
jgi:hypothetical protein